MSGNPVFLDVDSSICENNYLIKTDPKEDELNKLFASQGVGQLPPKLIKPTPGFCIKTKQLNSDKKIFINICQTDAIPAPKDITEFELQEILDTDEICDFRVPMSIGDVRKELDKKGEESSVCDIAIHPAFFQKIEKLRSFKEFFIAVAFEGLKEKFKIETQDEKIILKNRKAMGNLQTHRIMQREIDQKMGKVSALPTVDEILNRGDGKAKVIEVISDKEMKEPEYRLVRKLGEKDVVYAEVYLPYLFSSKDLSVDLGEDRIILESSKGNYFLDIFHEYMIDQSNSHSNFNKDTKFLTITMPIKTC